MTKNPKCADSTTGKQTGGSTGRGFRPGQSGNPAIPQSRNPAVRPKGTRNKLFENFVAALYADFEEHGIQAIQDVRVEKPGDYVKVVSSLIPAQFQQVHDEPGFWIGLWLRGMLPADAVAVLVEF